MAGQLKATGMQDSRQKNDGGTIEGNWNAGRLQRNDGGMSVTERFG